MRTWGALFMLASALLVSGCTSWHKSKDTQEPQEAQVVETPKKEKTRQRIKPRPVVKTPTETATRPTTELPHVFVPRMPGKRVAQVNVPGRYVALTFDDGPSPANTPKVLDILRRYGAKATFFVVGESAVRHKDILARAAAEGHEIASHTWSHINMAHSSDEKIISEMDRTNAVIAEATGRRPALMRPPYGATNARLQDLIMSRYGMPSVLWSVDTQDWKHPGVDVVIHRAVSPATNGSIILLHDIHASTLAAVEGVVRGLQQRGFTLVTVSELIEMGRRAADEAGVAAAPAPAAPSMANAELQPRAATAVMATPTAPAAESPAPAPASAQEVAYPSQGL